MGVETLLRLSAEVSACAARLGARVKIGGGQQRSLITAHVAGGAQQSCGEGSSAAQGAWQSCGEGSGAAQHKVEGVEGRRRGEHYKG